MEDDYYLGDRKITTLKTRLAGSEDDYYPGVRTALVGKLGALKALIGGRNPCRHPESHGREEDSYPGAQKSVVERRLPFLKP
jgi:hypothetical protein